MALWMVRAGKYGEYETKFLDESRVYATWGDLKHDLNQVNSIEQLRDLLRDVYPDFSEGKIINHSSQLWAFSHDMSPGDWIALPSKMKPAIHFAEITGAYSYDSEAQDPYYHSRPVKWIELDIPRSKFPQDLLYSLGAFLTICWIERNDAENRIRTMARMTGH